MSFAEMIVPYRDPASTTTAARRTTSASGGSGYMTTSLELGCDCLGEIVYLDAVLTDSHGEPFTVTNAICLHEEDNARAVEARRLDQRRAEVRRARRFVVSVPRHRRQLRVPRLLALLPGRQHRVRGARHRHHGHHAVRRGRRDAATGTLVDHRTYAPFHQHFLVARLDLDIDGGPNTVLEVDSDAPPIGPDNPYGLALTTPRPRSAPRPSRRGTSTGTPSAPGRWSTRTG